MTEILREGVQPFAKQFMEPIPTDQVLDASGHYDEKTQTWVLDGNGSDSSALMSGLNPERPPTTCSKMTKMSPTEWSSDTYTDD